MIKRTKYLFVVLMMVVILAVNGDVVNAKEEYDGGPTKIIYDFIGHYSLNYTGNTNNYDYWNSTGTGKLVNRVYKDRADVSGINNSSGTISQKDSKSSIKKAILIWQSRSEDAPISRIGFITPNETRKPIIADWICQDTRTNGYGEKYVGVYTMATDVTDIVCSSAGGYGTYTVANIPVWDGVQEGEPVCGGESVASWQLVVVEESPNFPLRTISLNILSQYFFNIDYTVTVNFADASAPNGEISAQFLDGSVDVDASYRYDGIGYPDDYKYEYEGHLYRYLTQARGLYKNGVCINSRDTGGVYGRTQAIGGTRVHLFDDYRRANNAFSQSTIYRWKDKNMGINVFLQGVSIDVFAYDIVFDGNGADAGSMENLTCIYGRGYNLSENQYTKQHWKFGGWNTKADGSGDFYEEKAFVRNLTATEEMVILYAQWEPEVYKVTLDNQYAMYAGTRNYYEWYGVGNYSTAECTREISKIMVPQKKGFDFGGYYTEKNGQGTKYVDSTGRILSKSTTFDSDTTLYAYWTSGVYKITLDNQEADISGTKEYYEKFAVGNYATADCTTEITKIEMPTKKHHEFAGYYNEKNGEGQQIINAEGNIIPLYTIFDKDTTIYAYWKPVTYTIMLDNQGAHKDGTELYYEKYGVENYYKIYIIDDDSEETIMEYGYTGSVQSFVAPHTGVYSLVCVGAGGEGEKGNAARGSSGAGGSSSGEIELKKGDILYIYVGGEGIDGVGGYNGGGDKLTVTCFDTEAYVGAGGGATDMRLNSMSLSKRVLIGAGGGGDAYLKTDTEEWLIVGAADARQNGNTSYYGVYFDERYLYQSYYFDEAKVTASITAAGSALVGEDISLGDDYGPLYVHQFNKGTLGTANYGGGGGYYGGGSLILEDAHGPIRHYALLAGMSGSGYIGKVDNGKFSFTKNTGNGYASISWYDMQIQTKPAKSITIPQKYGYEFGGYYTGKNGAGTQYVDRNGNILSKPTTFTEDTTLYAYWISTNINGFYYIAYNGNGADSGKMSMTTCGIGSSCKLSTNTFVKSGYTFAGWSTTEDGEVNYADNETVSNLSVRDGEVVTLYAKWEAANSSFMVKHYTENLQGKYELHSTDNKSGITGSKVDVPALKKEIIGFTYNYAMVKGVAATEASISADGSLVISLYYTRNSYELILEKDNGISSISGAGTYKCGETVYIDAEVKDNYTWYGWSGAYATIERQYEFIMPAEDITLQANTSPMIFNIYLESQRATTPGTLQYYEKYGVGNYKDEVCSKSIIKIELPVKKGYIFGGYYTGENGQGLQYVKADGTITSTPTTFTDDMVLYAKWTPITYIIHFDGNSAISGSMNDMICIYGQSDKLPPNKFERAKYSFVGWNTKADGSGFSYIDGADFENMSETQDEVITLYAQWTSNAYIIRFEGNGADGGIMEDMVCEFDVSYNLNENRFTRIGYEFIGWGLSPDSEIEYEDKAVVKNVSTMKGYITLYAQWTPATYSVSFDANRGVGTMEDVMLYFNLSQQLPQNLFTKSNEYGSSTFLGWNTDATATAALYEDEAEVMNIPGSENGHVTLYAIWDDCPWIIAEDLYYSLYEAQNGLITYDELMCHAVASDLEDGSLLMPGINHEKGTSFTIIDYLPTDFTQFTASGSVTETYEVIDSVGNSYRKMITVHVVDTTVEEVLPDGTTRFINEKYYNEAYENGGLEETSAWKTNSEFVAVIQKAFENSKNDTPLMSFFFTYEEIQKMKEFIWLNGIGNTESEDVLQRFYDEFMVPNTME